MTELCLAGALDLGTEVPTPHGMATVGELSTGDHVFGSDGRPVAVTAVSDPLTDRRCYEVGFSTGELLVVDEEQHLLTERRDVPLAASTALRRKAAEVAAGVASYGRAAFAVRVAPAVQLPRKRLPIEPYLLGVWLGAGVSDLPAVKGADDDLIRALTGTGVRVFSSGIGGQHWIAVPGSVRRGSDLGTLLRRLELIGDKHIPMLYLRSSEEQRRELLAGLLDAAGLVSDGGEVRFRSPSTRLAIGVHQLIASLGFRPWIRPQGRNTDVSFVTSAQVFARDRMRTELHGRRRPASDLRPRRLVTSVEPVPSRPVRRLRVAADDGLFLVGGSFIPLPGSPA